MPEYHIALTRVEAKGVFVCSYFDNDAGENLDDLIDNYDRFTFTAKCKLKPSNDYAYVHFIRNRDEWTVMFKVVGQDIKGSNTFVIDSTEPSTIVELLIDELEWIASDLT